MSLAIFCRKSFAVLFPAPLSAGQGQKVTGSIAHNLLNKTLQLLTINKTERAEIGVDAATSGIDIRQRHGNQLNIFDLSTGIQGATVSIAGGLPCQTPGCVVLEANPSLLKN